MSEDIGYLLPGAFTARRSPTSSPPSWDVTTPLPPAVDLLAQRIRQSWAQFAHTGNPETPAFTPWPATAPDTTLELGCDRIGLADSFARQHHCDLWSPIRHTG